MTLVMDMDQAKREGFNEDMPPMLISAEMGGLFSLKSYLQHWHQRAAPFPKGCGSRRDMSGSLTSAGDCNQRFGRTTPAATTRELRC